MIPDTNNLLEYYEYVVTIEHYTNIIKAFVNFVLNIPYGFLISMVSEEINMLRKRLQEAVFVCIIVTASAVTDSPSGGIVNGQPVGKCVAGFCLPLKYSSLDPPLIVDENNNTLPNNVNITTDIMDILMVRFN